jgi:hypothetical protein
MNLVGVDKLRATSNDVLDTLLDLLGPGAFPLGIEGLGDEALVELVGKFKAIFLRESREFVA